MCGIVGKVGGAEGPELEALVRRMCALTTHRGPDDEGVYVKGPVGLGSRRLSIIDLSGGHQPLCNEDGTVWLVFNGEVYNFQEQRGNLEKRGHHFRTRTDAEVVLHLYEEMGERCVIPLNGMFAFALWDEQRQRLMLARDRLGEKPLHYAITQAGLVFSSEIAPLLEDPGIERRVNHLALLQYLRLWYVPSPLTMFEGILKLPPAHVLMYERGKARLERYWDVDFTRREHKSEAEWTEQIRALLEDAVRCRLVSDVPVGALLSGGIDSSTVVALMAQADSRPVKTFSIGFDEEGYNELAFARLVAGRLGTEHHDEIVRPDAAAILPKLVWHYGEPFGDESCIPTYYVAKMAREHVTVALSGDGGDESFGGYPRLADFLAFSPRRSLAGLIATRARGMIGSGSLVASLLDVDGWRDFARELEYRLREIADPMERYAHAWVVWKHDARPLLAGGALARIPARSVLAPLRKAWRRTTGLEAMDRLLYLELMTYLPDDLQVKIDTASMAVSLEVRAPFLDHRLVELAARIPPELKISGGQTKVLLRRIVASLLPPEIPRRSKWGFSMPVSRWVAGELRPMVEDLLLGGYACQRGLLQRQVLEQMIRSHAAGQRDYGRHLWLLLNLELWLRAFFPAGGSLPRAER